jgi:hypothetical protein
LHGSVDNNIGKNPQDIFGKETIDGSSGLTIAGNRFRIVRRIDLIAPFTRTFAREGYKPGNQDHADRAGFERIASRLRGAKARCGPKVKPDDRRHYRGISFDFENPLIGARQLYEKLGPLPEGYSLDRIDPRGPYSLDNLKYSTPREQALNTRRADRFWR